MIWDFQTPRTYHFSGHKDAILDVCFSPLGNLVASGSNDRTVRLLVPSIRGTVEGIRAHVSAVRSVDFSPDGQTLLTASDDKQVKLWAVPQKKLLSNLHGHTNCDRCARFSPDGQLVASCSDDRTINIFDHVSCECVYTIKLLKGYANFVNFHLNGTCIAAAQNSGGVNVYDIRMKKLLQHYARHKAPVNKLAFHPCGSYLVTASDDSKIKNVHDSEESLCDFTNNSDSESSPSDSCDIQDNGTLEEAVEPENEQKAKAWWKKFVNEDHLVNIKYSGKLVLLFSILREAESFGQKVFSVTGGET